MRSIKGASLKSKNIAIYERSVDSLSKDLEQLMDQTIDHKALKTGRGDIEKAIDEQHIQQVHTGDVVFLKGALYDGASPIFHRSPSIEENGGKRLLFDVPMIFRF